MEIQYKPIESLEVIAEETQDLIQPNNYQINLLLSYELSATDLIRNPLKDVSEKAKEWSAPNCPSNLYFNHGQYVKGGISHIINELKEKPSSNRALYSLIDQETILDSGDKPIPSFMLFQSILDGDTLYCNVYLRAVEISKFLRINLEEIRLNVKEISESSITFDKVRLVILGCRAHHIPNFNPLEKPALDLATPYQIMKMLQEDLMKLRELLIEKADIQTILDTKSLKYIHEYISGEWKKSNKAYLINLLDKVIKDSSQLESLRTKHSHNQEINRLSDSISKDLKSIGCEITK